MHLCLCACVCDVFIRDNLVHVADEIRHGFSSLIQFQMKLTTIWKWKGKIRKYRPMLRFKWQITNSKLVEKRSNGKNFSNVIDLIWIWKFCQKKKTKNWPQGLHMNSKTLSYFDFRFSNFATGTDYSIVITLRSFSECLITETTTTASISNRFISYRSSINLIFTECNLSLWIPFN